MYNDTLSLVAALVKPPKTVRPIASIVIDTNNDFDDLLDQAARWGHEDATEHIDLRGSDFFAIGGPAWRAYNDGFARGLVVRKQMEGESDELAFLGAALDQFRGGQAESTARLTKAQMLEIENERIGEDFSIAPYLY